MQDKTRPAIVTGAARSGTSIIGGVLHYLGVDMGEYYLKPDTQNPTGYFEDARMIEIDYKYYERDKKEWYKKMQEYLKTRKGLWGFKSPQLAVSIQDMKSVLNSLDLKPRYILSHRDFSDVLNSQIKHHGEKQEKEVRFMKDNLEHALNGEETLNVYFTELRENPNQSVGKIIEYLHLTPSQDQITRAILSIIGPPPKEGDSVQAVPARLY